MKPTPWLICWGFAFLGAVLIGIAVEQPLLSGGILALWFATTERFPS